MKARHWVIACVVTGLLVAGLMALLVTRMVPPAAQAAPLDPSQAATAERFLDHLDAGRYDEAHAMLAPAAAVAVSVQQLEEIWSGLPKTLGERVSRSAPRGEVVASRNTTTVTLSFAAMALDARIGTDDEQRIDGFRLVPAKAAAVTAAPPVGVVEREFTVGDPALPGTLSLPPGDGPFPAVVLVHGSGPHGRDQSIGPNHLFRELAHALAQHGIAALRYDKRTYARPDDPVATIDEETVDDAVAAVGALRTDASIDAARVYVVGHSLGAMMAPRILQRAPAAAGGVLMAAPARPLHDIVPEQIAYLIDLDGERSAEEAQALAEARTAAEAVRALAHGGPEDGLLLALPASYWRSLLEYDQLAVAASLPQPLLILQGGRDYQVTPAELVAWQQRLGSEDRVALRLYPRLNHLFAAGDGASRPEEYFRETSLDPAPIDDIAGWIHGH
jgi:uncharacterized protein